MELGRNSRNSASQGTSTMKDGWSRKAILACMSVSKPGLPVNGLGNVSTVEIADQGIKTGRFTTASTLTIANPPVEPKQRSPQ